MKLISRCLNQLRKEELWRWKYYFLYLPLFSCGGRSLLYKKNLYRVFAAQEKWLRAGYLRLCEYQNRTVGEADIKLFLKKAFWVKIVRESDAYTSLRMSRPKFDRFFEVCGSRNLQEAAATGRPVIILSGHTGSFYTGPIALSHMGFEVYPMAKSVDYLSAAELSTRSYMKANFLLSGLRLSPAGYIFTDFLSGKTDRRILELGRKGKIISICIDITKSILPRDRHPVTFLGKRSTLPSGIVRWGVKKNAIFLTAWNCVEGLDNGQFRRKVNIEAPIPFDNDPSAVLQTYADRLSNLIFEQPWQWMGIQGIHEYAETA